jgi:DNA mismatch repair ATPase MutS
MVGNIILVGAIAIIIISLGNRIRADNLLRRRLAGRWGGMPMDRCSAENLKSIATYFLNSRKESNYSFVIDDVTWRDLDMDETFARLNHTVSTAGEECLYRLLREPCFDPLVLNSRLKLIEYFQTNSTERFSVQLILARLGKKRGIGVTDYFYQSDNTDTGGTAKYRVLGALALIGPMMLFVSSPLGIALTLLILWINGSIYYKTRNEIASHLDAMMYVVGMVGCVRRLVASNITGLDDLSGRLSSCFGRIRKIERKGLYLDISENNILANLVSDYVNLLLLKELVDYKRLRKIVDAHKKDLLEVYGILGLIDSMISVASYRKTVPFYTVPCLTVFSPGHPRRFEFKDICHPLIGESVPNSLETEHSVLITGSNASGKSTFLKAAAINAIFAQSIMTCLARHYSSNYYAVFTSMAMKDNVLNGESYFIAEIKSIKRILDSLNDEKTCLCFIDEVLRGTNTVERIAASSQVLVYLANQNCLCLAATHDIELTHILSQFYRNVHFQEEVIDNRILFDYRVKEGRATSRNAIKLLGILGYHEDIVINAEESAHHFMTQGSWKEI